jgi:hypothetical protein
VSGYRILEKDVILDGSRTYVVDDERTAIGRPPIRDNAYVRQIAGKHPRNQVSGKIVAFIARDVHSGACTLKELLEIRYAAVVDVGVRLRETPDARIERKVCSHVFVDENLEVDADGSVGADDNVRTHAAVGWNVAPRISDACVSTAEMDPQNVSNPACETPARGASATCQCQTQQAPGKSLRHPLHADNNPGVPQTTPRISNLQMGPT